MTDDNEKDLGKGLYASFDGWHFCLRDSLTDQRVYLEIGYGCSLDAFQAYVREQLLQAERDLVEAEENDERRRAAAEGFPDD